MADSPKRNANYAGDDPSTMEWQARSDALIAEFGQARLKDDATLSALDRDLIKELVVLYDNAFDALDKQSFLHTMTADIDYQSNAFGDTTGHAGMSAWWDEFTKTFHSKRHLLTNFVLIGGGDSARAMSYLTVHERIDHTDMVGTCTYFDDFTKNAAGAWRISKRIQILDPGMTKTRSGQALLKTYIDAKQQK
ncbi:MAG: nuclear transport factor 2 family protein [Propionivibrio sp.]